MRFFFTFLLLSLIPLTGFAGSKKLSARQRLVGYQPPGNAFSNTASTSAARASGPGPSTKPQWAFLFETRPSFPSNQDKAYSENLAELGIRINPDLYVGYQQTFSNNIKDNDPTLEDGPQLALTDGYLTTQIKNIWKTPTSSFSMEPRLYVPTDELLRARGMVTRVRTHFNYRVALSKGIALHLIEVPIFHVYDRAGSGTADAGFVANPSLENRFYFAQEFTLSSWCALWLPLRLKSTRFANFRPDAKNNDKWSHLVTLYPELTFTLSKTIALGLAYETANLMTEDLSKTSISDGIANGISQVFFRLSF